DLVNMTAWCPGEPRATVWRPRAMMLPMSRPEPGETPAERDEYDLGRHIRQARMQQELTLDALAAATGLSRSYLSNLERNVNSPTIGTLRTILDALGVSLSELFRNVEQERQRHT